MRFPPYCPVRGRRYAAGVIGCLLLLCGWTGVAAQNLDVPYVPTPQAIVDRMLEIAEVEDGDYVIDLGSGDGRIVISAAKRGAVGHGVDLDPERIMEARRRAREEGVDDRVMFLRENIFQTDIRNASVITMYLLTSVNLKLRPRLLAELEPGTRIVSHSFGMDDWKPDFYEDFQDAESLDPEIYFWIVPAKVEGRWSWTADGERYVLSVDQNYQELDIELRSGDRTFLIREVVLKGKRLSFIASDGVRRVIHSGRVENDTINGYIQVHRAGQARMDQWSALRLRD